METTLMDALYEELAMLVEQAGCFDEVTNAQIDAQRRRIMIQLIEMESA